MMAADSKSVLITGVSSGIGLGAARMFTRAGYRVFGTVRSDRDAHTVRAACGGLATPVVLDVRDLDSVARLPQVLGELGLHELDGLICNAGVIRTGPVLTQPLADIEVQIAVNVVGLIAVTKALLPMLGAGPEAAQRSSPGRIINISSTGGRIATPFIAGYNATKYAVEGFSHALRRELSPFGIAVVIVAPGAVQSRIWQKASASAQRANIGSVYRQPYRRFEELSRAIEAGGYTSDEAGRFLVRVFEARSPRTRYAAVRGRLVNWTIPSLLPDRWLDVVMRRTLALS